MPAFRELLPVNSTRLFAPNYWTYALTTNIPEIYTKKDAARAPFFIRSKYFPA